MLFSWHTLSSQAIWLPIDNNYKNLINEKLSREKILLSFIVEKQELGAYQSGLPQHELA